MRSVSSLVKNVPEGNREVMSCAVIDMVDKMTTSRYLVVMSLSSSDHLTSSEVLVIDS